MKVELKRISENNEATFGVLILDGMPLCVTLEDLWKDNKKNISCIPTGTYKCEKHYGTLYKNVWKLLRVPNRSAILIHSGNTDIDTEGCILVGERFGKLGGRSAVLGSRLALNYLRRVLPDEFELTITNNF